MTMVGENGPELDGWHVQPAKHCGLICVDFACPVCGMNVPQPHIVRGEN